MNIVDMFKKFISSPELEAAIKRHDADIVELKSRQATLDSRLHRLEYELQVVEHREDSNG